jgi:preprotein translocase subunit SecG
MIILLTIVHVIVCVFLVIVVLLQSGKAADLAGAFGGMGSQTAFGPRGSATVLSKATTLAAGLFMVTSLVLAVASTRNAGVGQTILEKHGGTTQTQKSAPASTPAKGPAVPMPDVSGGAAGSPAKPAPSPAAPAKK